MSSPTSSPISGAMIVREATWRDRQYWDEYVLNHQDESPYHLFAWREAIEQAYHFSCHCLLAEDRSGIKGGFPIALVRFPWGKGTYISLPFCDFGGVIADEPRVALELIRRATDWIGSPQGRLFEMRSPTPLSDLDQDAFRLSSKVRMVMDLPHGSEALFSGFKSKLRSQIRKPQRDGLTTENGGAELLNAFYRVLSRNMRDLGSPVHSRKWFRTLLEGYGERMRIFLVRMPDKQPAAAGIMLCTKRSVTVPWASSLRELNRWNPNMLLYWTMIAYAADGGWQRFDFGRSTPGEGTWKFKQQWGARPAPLYWGRFRVRGTKWSVRAAVDESSTGRRGRAIAEGLIRKLPVSWATFLGSRVRRYISL